MLACKGCNSSNKQGSETLRAGEAFHVQVGAKETLLLYTEIEIVAKNDDLLEVASMELAQQAEAQQ